MSSATSGPRILLIEDEMLVAGMLKGMLSSLGYVVAGTATNVAEVMDVVDHETIDAVVLDINLNGQMSYPIADELAGRGIPFIFSTGYEKQSLPARHEARPWLKKPFRRSALGGVLADLLKKDQERPDRPHAARHDRLEAAAEQDNGSRLSGFVSS
jgi:CheY-like chemotaxis protein